MLQCAASLKTGPRKGEQCPNPSLKNKLYCSRHNKTQQKVRIIFEDRYDQKFLQFDFMRYMLSGLLDLNDLLNLAFTSADLHRFFLKVRIWRRKAIGFGLLPQDTKCDGLIECIHYNSLLQAKKTKRYKTYILKEYQLDLYDITHLLESVRHFQYNSVCHVVPRVEAFKIACMKHDGLENIDALINVNKMQSKNQKKEIRKARPDRIRFLEEHLPRLNNLQASYCAKELEHLLHWVKKGGFQTTISSLISQVNEKLKRIDLVQDMKETQTPLQDERALTAFIQGAVTFETCQKAWHDQRQRYTLSLCIYTVR